ncbi:peptidoglycan bridge formation glycyltransferase FemA/FemB family protein [Candidatus Nomurabacteria bacterium]|nr:peptidoglycan bridge formation glycyltransferase FemA/FemB family protein [Candidatus Nomurabacteria bacterium]
MSLEKQHFLQSLHWKKFQNSLGKKTIQRSEKDWSYLAIIEGSKSLRRLYCPYGPTVASQDSLKSALSSLKSDARKLGVHVVRLQPNGVRIDKSTADSLKLIPVDYSQPTVTWRLDLSPTLEDMHANMKQNTRNICRNYHKKGMSYRSSSSPKDIGILTNLLAGVASHNNITVHSHDYLEAQAKSLLLDKSCMLHFIYFDNQPIAAALTYMSDETVYYAHAAADYEHRKLGASTALLGEIIKWAKNNGYKTFDFYGIAPTDDPSHPQAGFTRFKKSFGGYEHRYNQTFELVMSPARYQLYSAARKLYRKLR